MSEVSTMERVIRSDVSMEECKKIEKKDRKHERYSRKLTREYNKKYNANIQL